MMRTLVLGLSTVLLCACTRFGLSANETPSRPQTASSGRPSENGEGVPGYLTNPKAITFVHDNASLVVKGAVGNLRASQEFSVLPIYIYLLPQLTEGNVKKLGEDSYEVQGQLLVSSFANPDGSIHARGPDASNGPYVLKIGGLAADPLRIDSFQTHVTLVYAAAPGATPEILSLKLLRETYPNVFTTTASTLNTKEDCNAQLRYWNSMTGECSSLSLAKLKNCWPTPDLKLLVAALKDKVGDSEKDDLKDYVDDGVELDQCYYETGNEKIAIVGIERIAEGMKLRRVEVKVKDVEDQILP